MTSSSAALYLIHFVVYYGKPTTQEEQAEVFTAMHCMLQL